MSKHDDEVDGTSSETAMAAAKTAASFAEDADEFRMFLDMLGLSLPGRPTWTNTSLVDNSKARRHIQMLHDKHDIAFYRIAKAARLSPNTVREIVRGVPASRRRVIAAILAVTPEDCALKMLKCRCGAEFPERRRGMTTRCQGCAMGRVEAGPTRERLLLLRRTMTCGEIAQLAEVGTDALRSISHPDPARAQRFVLPDTEARVLAVPLPLAVSA